jgi:hypothetical protein
MPDRAADGDDCPGLECLADIVLELHNQLLDTSVHRRPFARECWLQQLHSRPEVFLFALSRLTCPSRRDAGIDVLAHDAVATKELAAIFLPFVPATKYGQAGPDHAIIQQPAWKRCYTVVMSTAPRYEPCYTVEDYRHWEGRWELWNGVPVPMTPSPFGRHAKALTDAAATFKQAVDAARASAAGCRATVLTESIGSWRQTRSCGRTSSWSVAVSLSGTSKRPPRSWSKSCPPPQGIATRR